MEIIKLNLIPNGVNPVCHASQYDNGRVIRGELFDGLTPYTLASGDVVALNVRKPDNHVVTETLTATAGNSYVDIVTTEQMTACFGENLCELKITNGNTEIGTINFYMIVERDVLANGDPSQSVIEDLDALVQEAVGDNFYNKSETDALLYAKADKSTTYTKTEVDSAFDDIIDLEIPFNVSGFINKTTGAIVANTDYASTDFIEIKGIKGSIRYTVKTFSSIAICCLYDAAKKFISSIASSSSSVVEEKGVVSNFENARYIRFCSYIINGYTPALTFTNISSLNIYGDCIGVDNIEFKEHNDKTNLIDLNLCALGYINGNTDGSVHASTSFYYTDYIKLKQNVDYYFNSNYFYGGYCAFYDANKNYISGYGVASASNRLNSPFKIPSGAVYARFTIASESHLPNAWLCETNQMSSKPADYSNEIKTKFIADKPTDYKGDDICVFNKILCIGDSLTDGFFNESGGSRLIIRSRSYPAKLQTLTGIDCTNLGYSGYTSVQWYNAYQSEDLSGHDACIIQLGVNDQLQNVSESTMDAALTSIIQKVKSDNSGIKIFVATVVAANGYMTTAMASRSQMIRDFVANLNDPDVYLVDMWRYAHTDDLLAFDAGHLSAYGYLQLAKDYKAYISYIIRNNPSDFRYIQFIGTNYQYDGEQVTRSITY